MNRITTLGLAHGVALVFAFAAGTSQAQVKIGMGGPITGPSAATGAQMKNGVDQAAPTSMPPAAFWARRSSGLRRRRLRSEARRIGRQ